MSLLSEGIPPNHCKYRSLAGFLLFYIAVDPYFYPLQIQNRFCEALHAGCTVLLHPLSEMRVTVQRERCRGVAQVALYRLDIVPGPNRIHGVCMPGIVEADTIQAGGDNNPLEVVVHVPLL